MAAIIAAATTAGAIGASGTIEAAEASIGLGRQAKTRGSIRDRLRGALLGAFIADAIAAPYHWFYDQKNVPKYVGTHSSYVRPNATHVESMMQAMGYEPNPDNPIDIFKDKASLYDAGDGSDASRD